MSACHLIGDVWSVTGSDNLTISHTGETHRTQYTLCKTEGQQLAIAILTRIAEIETLQRCHDEAISRANETVRMFGAGLL